MTDTPDVIQNSNGIWMLEGEQLWDTDLLPIILEHVNPGDTVIDAGAWIGGHTMAYRGKVGDMGFVYAFEPNPKAFECLKLNTAKWNDVQCFNSALGDKVKQVCFSGMRGWYDSSYLGEDHKLFVVGMDALDNYYISPNFIKIDVEGCELKVLNGAEKTIVKHKPVMVIEVNEPALKRQGNTAQELADWILGHGYEFEFIEKDVKPDTEIYNILCKPI